MNINEWLSMSNLQRHEWISTSTKPMRSNISRRRLIYGVAENDAGYLTYITIDGVKVVCPAFAAWKDMITRACSEKFKSRTPSYVGVSVCREWLMFSGFVDWWRSNQVDGWQLDKDLLTDSSEYSDKSCIFIPQWLNKFTTGVASCRGRFYPGVSFDMRSGRYTSKCRDLRRKNAVYTGSFTDPLDAWCAWMDFKLSLLGEMRCELDEIDKRLFHRVSEIINKSCEV